MKSSTPRSIAVIGTRELHECYPRATLDVLDRAIAASVAHGYQIRTGAAVGTDQYAAEIVLRQGGALFLALPWARYEASWVHRMTQQYPGHIQVEVYDPIDARCREWGEFVRRYHPRGNSLSRGAFALHARNYRIVESARAVIALPSTQKSTGGGTSQGMRIAYALDIPVFNLSYSGDVQSLAARVGVHPL